MYIMLMDAKSVLHDLLYIYIRNNNTHVFFFCFFFYQSNDKRWKICAETIRHLLIELIEKYGANIVLTFKTFSISNVYVLNWVKIKDAGFE